MNCAKRDSALGFLFVLSAAVLVISKAAIVIEKSTITIAG
ncbi:MAG: hypothetical protein GQF41_4242 [Candidatus Rifleibacterium amylolyticum]|nr:MAG: hypothetical protein GQF41_4242 [Candidatus Rifleibacterium amylolyticum]